VFLGFIALIWCGILIPGLVTTARQKSPWALVVLLMLAYGVVYLYSEYRVRLVIRRDGLVARNRFRRYAIAPENITDITIGPTGWDPLRECVWVRTRDGRDVELAVTRRMDSIRGRRILLETLLDELTRWKTQALAGRPDR
jgi:hypothetical protein